MTNQTNTEIQAREKRRAELGETQFASGTQGGALMNPQNGRELMDMANMMAASGQMVRDFYRGNPGDCAGLIMICQPYGFNPFMVSWKTYKASKSADAPVSFEAQLVNAMVNMSAPVKGRLRYTYDGEGPTRRCTVQGTDRETGEVIDYTSPMLKDIPVKNSPLWKSDPDQQLGYYSARSWARRHFPELLLGVYTREEIEEAPPRDITPREAPALDKLRAKAGMATKAEVDAPAKAEVEEAQVVPDEQKSTDEKAEVDGASHWTETVDTEAAFPGSDEWTDGAKAFAKGMKRAMCPHTNDLTKAADWLGGYDGARRAGE